MAATPRLMFGDLLRRHRLAAGLTLAELAERASLSSRAISDLERGVNRRPRRETFLLLCEALNLSPLERSALEMATRRSRRMPDPAMSVEAFSGLAVGERPPLVGRAHELAVLARHLEGVDPAAVVFLVGEPGIGKSRLLHEAAQFGRSTGWSMIAGSCHRRSGQEPYAPLLGALERCLANLPLSQRRTALRGCGWLVKLLPELAGEMEPLPAWTLTPEQERRLLFGAVGRLLDNLAGPAGTLLLLDDLQWAGQDALDLLATLVRATSSARLLRLVCAYRETDVPANSPLAVLVSDLAREGRGVRAALEPLPDEDADTLLSVLLGGAVEETTVLRQRLLERTGGVPYFLVSCAQSLRASTTEIGLAQEALPWDVAESIRQRVAVLPDTARDVLAAAAVVGRRVEHRLLVAVASRPGRDEAEVLAGLEAACRARLMTEESEGAYAFAHDLVREAVSADLSAARRAGLHGRVAAALERDSSDPPAELLAYHYGRAEDMRRAVIYLERAGDRALAMRAYAEAERYYRELTDQLDALGRGRDAADARTKLGELLNTRVRFDEALEVLERAIGGYKAIGDVEGQVRALAQVGAAHASRGSAQAGIDRIRGAVRELGSGGPRELARLYSALAVLYFRSGQYDEQLAASNRAAELASTAGDDRMFAVSQSARGMALYHLGRMGEAIASIEAAVRGTEAVGDLRTLSRALNNLALPYYAAGENHKGLPYVRRALEVAERIGDPTWIAFMTYRRGEVAFYLGDWTQAREDYERSVAMMRELGTSWSSAYPVLLLGHLRLACGEWEAGFALLNEAIALARRGDDLQGLRMAQCVLAERDVLEDRPEEARERLVPLLDRPGRQDMYATMLLPILAWARMARGELSESETLIAQAFARADASAFRLASLDALRIQALLEARRARWHESERAARQAVETSRSMPYPYAEAKALYVGGLVHLARGEREQAREWFTVALPICARLGERLYAGHIERELASLPPAR